jgi:L-ribulokinase
MSKYTIGVDFGTESGRALLVQVSDGAEIAMAVHPYGDGVIDQTLPGDSKPLPPDWALQNPMDYIEVFKQTVPSVLKQSGVSPDDVIGISVDFTACTMLPVKADGTPLCVMPEYKNNPHAWIKLWKHHAAQAHADRINETARSMNEPWLPRYGGKISSEWFFSKALQILEEAPEIYNAADRFIEATDWVTWQLCGRETRNACTAGYKAIFQKDYPSKEYFAALNPAFANVVEEKMSRDLVNLGDKAGGLTAQAAQWTGLKEGTTVAVANVDAHVTFPATGDVASGTMVMIMGTSTCHMLVADSLKEVEGMCGVVMGGIVPGRYGYEAGQSGVGDIFAWFVDNAVPSEYFEAAEKAGVNVHKYLEQEAAKQRVGEHGLLALDWFNGNRSVLVDAELTGLMVGMTLATKAPDMYRALLEATAYGTRKIIESFESNGVPVNKLIAAGGLPARNPLMMQIYADVCQKDLYIIQSEQGPALGAAMHAAVAAGAYEDIQEAAKHMGRLSQTVYKPIAENVKAYDGLYKDYVYLHDVFGRSKASEVGGVMKRLRVLRHG